MGRYRVSLFLAVLAIAGSAGLLSPATAGAQWAAAGSGFRTLAREQNPMVVAIRTTKWLNPTSEDDIELFERLFARAFPRGFEMRREVASGFLISADGEILTNDHVIAGADVIEVQLLGREATSYRAKVIGRDPFTDSALIRLVNPPANLPVATLGDSAAVASGDWVMAIGNPYQLGHSVSVGVISYPRRLFEVREGHWQQLIQTDASINMGSSGGPLLNARGEVVGISFAVIADALGDSMGIGFAVPINAIKAVLPQLRAGRVVRGSIGVHLRMTVMTDDDAQALGVRGARGALVTSVDPASSAKAAGLRAGDVITEFLAAPIATAEELMTRIAQAAPGSRAAVVLIRDGRTRAADVDVEAWTSPDVRDSSRALDRPATVGLTFLDAATGGALVSEVEFGSPADIVGIEVGDILRKVNTHAVRTAEDAERALRHVLPGRTAFVILSREGAEQLLELHAY